MDILPLKDLQVNMCMGQPGFSKPGFLLVETTRLPFLFMIPVIIDSVQDISYILLQRATYAPN